MSGAGKRISKGENKMNKQLIMEIANESGLLVILEQHAGEFGNGTLADTPYPELEMFTRLILEEWGIK